MAPGNLTQNPPSRVPTQTTSSPPPSSNRNPILTLPPVPPIVYAARTVVKSQHGNAGASIAPYDHAASQAATKRYYAIKYAKPDEAFLKEAAFWSENRDKLSDTERARIENIDEMLKPLEDPAWYYWPTWAEAIETGRHGTEEALRSSETDIRWVHDRPMAEAYHPIAADIQLNVKSIYPLNEKYWVSFIDRPLGDLKNISHHAILPLVYLVGEKGGVSDIAFSHTGLCHTIHDRIPHRGMSYRHIMFPINKWGWLCDLPIIFPDIYAGGEMNSAPLRSSLDQGYHNAFIKPSIQVHPAVGKPKKVTLSLPILCVKKGLKLWNQKTAEKCIRLPEVLRAPGYEYSNRYRNSDGRVVPKPPIWGWTTPLDSSLTVTRVEPFEGPPAVYSGRSLFEYRYPTKDTLPLDLRQTTRRGKVDMDIANDDFIMVEQLWAVVVPSTETLVTFQTLTNSFQTQLTGADNSRHMFSPSKGTEIVIQGPVHGLLVFFADLVLLQHYDFIDIFGRAAANLNFRVSNSPVDDDDLLQDCSSVLTELSIIIEITNSQMQILEEVQEAMITPDLRTAEYEEATRFYLFLKSRLEIVVRDFINLQSEAKQAQTLLFQLLSIETAKLQTKLATQQAAIAEQTAQETAIQLELAKRASEQGKSFLVFTIVTTVFLPLSFFTSYFGMNTSDIRDMEKTQSDFWRITAPASTMIILLAMCWAFRIRLIRGIRIIYNNIHGSNKFGSMNSASSLEMGLQNPEKQQKKLWEYFGWSRIEKKD